MKSVASLILDLIRFPFSGWVLASLWRWFIVPAFGLPRLHWTQAVGLLMVAALVSPPTLVGLAIALNPKTEKWEKEDRDLLSSGVKLLEVAMLWLSAAIWHALC